MIPQFPEFKKLELSDKDEIESFTRQFPPYSDFNFVSMWSWDTKSEMRVSWLNCNLVVKFLDYISGEPFLSFLGTTNVNETALKLIEVSKILGFKSELSLVPECAAELLDHERFAVKEEPNHFDYIYDIPAISKMEDALFKKRRSYIRNFLTYNGAYKVLDVNSLETREAIEAINNAWTKNRLTKNAKIESSNESLAVKRFLDLDFHDNVVATFLFIETTPVGYSIYEKGTNGYVVCHFGKTDVSYKGVNEYLMKQDSLYLQTQGVHLMNIEQDLGIDGLKRNKMSFSTGIYLKKYSVVLK